MRPLPSPIVSPAVPALLLAAALSAPLASAADAPPDLELDFPRLMADLVAERGVPPIALYEPDRAGGDDGMKLRWLPFRIPSGTASKPGTSPVLPGGARFVAWYVPPHEGAWPEGLPALHPGTPRLTRAIEIKDGRISWELSKMIPQYTLAAAPAGPGVIPAETLAYAYVLQPEALKAIEPAAFVRPERGPGEKAADHNARVKALQDAHKAQMEAWRAFSTRVRALPRTFTAPVPPVVYALCLVPDKPRRMSWSGPGMATCEYTMPQWQALLELAGHAPFPLAADQKPATKQAHLATLTALTAQPPGSLRFLAAALASSKLLDEAPAPDALAYRTAVELLQSKDPHTCDIITRAFERMPPSMRKADFLGQAAKAYDGYGPAARAAELRTLQLRAVINAPENKEPAASTRVVLEVVCDPSGAPPADAVREWVSRLDPAAFPPPPGVDPTQAGGDRPVVPPPAEVKKWLAECSLAKASPARRQEALRTMLALAPDSWVAAMGVEQLGLQPGQPEDALFVLNLVAKQAEGKAERLPLEDAQHPLFFWAAQADDRLRHAALAALAGTRAQSAIQSPGLMKPGAVRGHWVNPAVLTAIMQRVVDDGLVDITAGRPMPPERVAFVLSHLDVKDANGQPVAAPAAIRLLAAADDKAAAPIVDMLQKRRATSAPLLKAGFGALEPAQVLRCVAKLYAAQQEPLPLPTAFMLHPPLTQPLAGYFTESFAKDHYPSGEEWSVQCPGGDALLDQVMNENPAIAKSAVACLAYRVGAGDAGAEIAIKRILGKPYKTRNMVQAAWEDVRGRIFFEQIKALDGIYTVRVKAWQADDKKWAEQDVGQLPLTLGNDRKVNTPAEGFVFTAAEDRVVITLEEAARLDRIDPKARTALGITTLAGQVVFNWKDGRWLGSTFVEDARGRREVIMELLPQGWKPPLPKKPAETREKAEVEDAAKPGQVGGALEGKPVVERAKDHLGNAAKDLAKERVKGNNDPTPPVAPDDKPKPPPADRPAPAKP